MSVINLKYTGAYSAQANGRGLNGDAAAETLEQTLEKAEATMTLTLEWLRLLNPTAGAGRQGGQRLHARWRVK